MTDKTPREPTSRKIPRSLGTN